MYSRRRYGSIHTHARQAHKSRPARTQSERGNPLIDPLTVLARRLTYVRGTAVTAELALRAQNSDQDTDVADCLRVGVCDPLDDQVTQLTDLIESLSKTSPE